MEEKEILVKVEGLSKKFCKDLKTSLKYGVKDLFANLGRNDKPAVLRKNEFWAVKDINFELRRGECLGLIGHNGAGKSTLLKILNGLINPDEGKVTIKGKVGALIELGAGFNPILSGRENIYNNGAILGFTRNKIHEKLEEIIDFAELREFIDMPVQNYSSGMKVRLGFAVAAQMEPDVLIIDEVLAVGDLGFVLKCFKTIDNILPKTAIVYVSHNMPQVSRLCSHILLLEKGEAKFQSNDVSAGIDYYYSYFANNESKIVFNDGSIEMLKAKILHTRPCKKGIYQIDWGEDLIFYFKFKLNLTSSIPKFGISIMDKEQRPIAYFQENQNEIKLCGKEENLISFIVTHKGLQLSKGVYFISLHISSNKLKAPSLRINDLFKIQVIHEMDIWYPHLLSSVYENRSIDF